MSSYRKLLGSKSYLSVNKHLVKLFGIETAYFLSNLIDFEDYLLGQNMLEVEGGWFFYGREAIQEELTLSPHKQKECEKVLLENGLIEIKLKGVPARNNYRICAEQVMNIFNIQMLKNLRTGSQNISDHIYNQEPIYQEPTIKEENFQNLKIEESKPTQAPKEVTNFIEFFDLYPKKEKLEFAQREYNRLIRSHEATHEQIMQGARTQLESLQNREYKYIPLPETWLRSKAFLDQKPTENQTQPTTQTQQKQSKWHLQPKIVSQWDDETNEEFEERCRNIEDTELMHTMRMYKSGGPKTGWSEMFVPQY